MCLPCATSAAVGKSFATASSSLMTAAAVLVLPHTGLPLLFTDVASISVAPRG